MKKLIIIGLVFLCLVATAACVNAELTQEGTATVFKLGSNIDYKIICENNGTDCSSTSACNLTLFNPNLELLVNNWNMSNQQTYYNYTLLANITNSTGIYSGKVRCIDNGQVGSGPIAFLITIDGKSGNEEMYKVYFLLATILLGLILLIFAHYASEPLFTYCGAALFLVCGVYLFAYGIGTGSRFLEVLVSIVLNGIGMFSIVIGALAHLRGAEDEPPSNSDIYD